MGKELERDLGLPSITAISIGAMVGSGIFILPGLAMKQAGPAVVFAYLLAGVLVLPAALSKSEMATAMPEAGGTYLYIERGMGPILGTIAGVGTWFSLAFKGALALVGGAPYLVLYFDLPVTPVALAVAVVLILVNVVGAKQTGRMQIAIVVVMLATMVWFILFGAPGVEQTRYDQFFGSGVGGLLGATGFVYVSYAGVTKVASVAEEVENPDRNIPLGILGSLFVTTIIYVAIVAVMVGVAPASDLVNSDVPMAIAAEQVLSGPGKFAVVVAALLALISTANAGILSSSRYPFAMSRDDLAPAIFERVNDRFKTPVPAITVTGAVLLVLVARVPINDIAKLASAFQILVFILVNLAVVAFRQSDADYDPSFRTPLYPLPQAFGVVGGGVLLTQMGLVPLVGAAGIIVGSLVWYFLFVYRRGGVDREGAATDVVRRNVGRRVVSETETQVDREAYTVLVAVTEDTSPATERGMVDLATAIARGRDGGVRVGQFDVVPDQTPLDLSADRITDADRAFEKRQADRATDTDIPIVYGEVVSHDTRHAIVNYATDTDADALIIEQENGGFSGRVLGDDADWVEDHAPCDVIEVSNYEGDGISTVAVVTDGQPFDPSKVAIADAIATESDATLELYYRVDGSSLDTQRDTIGDYLTEVEDICTAPVETRVVDAGDPLADVARDAQLLVVSGSHRNLWNRLPGVSADDILDIDCPGRVVIYDAQQPGPLVQTLTDRLF